tara:strand:- start:348 stop:1154 length:807 start_codon:yes stop_codon:yes gene_type:complete
MTIEYQLMVLLLGLGLAACGGDGGGDSASLAEPIPNGTVDMGASMADSLPDAVDDPFVFEPNADCEFDESQAGKGPGAQIANFMPEQYNGTLDEMGRETGAPFHFHSFCGGGAEVVWVFLTTGWCGACETYADKALDYLQAHAPQGLKVVWIVGEDAEYNPPSKTYMSQYRTNKLDRDRDGVVSEAEASLPFVIIRDNDFNNTRRFIDPSAAGSSLPRQYVLDASNMLMVFASNPQADPPRPFIQGECEMRRLLGVLDIDSCDGYMGE